jgi:hypothetical protein
MAAVTDEVTEPVTVDDVGSGQVGYEEERAICLDGSRQGWIDKEARVIDRWANPFRFEIKCTGRGIEVYVAKGEQADPTRFALRTLLQTNP